jgi:hypothetical protein
VKATQTPVVQSVSLVQGFVGRLQVPQSEPYGALWQLGIAAGQSAVVAHSV